MIEKKQGIHHNVADRHKLITVNVGVINIDKDPYSLTFNTGISDLWPGTVH